MSEEQISQEVNPQPQPVVSPVPEITPKPQGYRLKIVLFSVLGVLVFVGAVFGSYKLGQKQVQRGQQPTPIPGAVATPTPDLTVNWKTYVSTKASYSFKYPQEWPLVNVTPALGCTGCVEDIHFSPVEYDPNSSDSTLAVILVSKEDRIKLLDDYINIHVKGDPSIIDIKNTTLGGEKAVSYRLSSGILPLPVIEYAVVKNNLYYTVRLEDSLETNKNKAENVKTFNLMLSTFRFLPSAGSTSSP